MISWAFLGGKEQGERVLNTLIEHNFLPSLIVTMTETPEVEQARFRAIAEKLRVPFAFDHVLLHHRDALARLDVALVCRFPMLPESLFSLPRLGCVNIHCSLLPRWRGVHPVQWALVSGDRETGVTLHSIDAGVDTGAIRMQQRLAIHDDENFASLTGRLNVLSATMALSLFQALQATGALPQPLPSVETSSYARRRAPEDSRIDWAQNSAAVCRFVRAMQPPMPRAFFTDAEGNRYEAIRCAAEPHQSKASPGTLLERSADDTCLIRTLDGAVRITTETPA